MKITPSKNIKKIVKKCCKNTLHLTLVLATAISLFAFHQNLFAQEGSDDSGSEQDIDIREELTGLELGPSGELPTFIQFFNGLMYEDAESNPRAMSEIIQSEGAVLKAQKVFCDGEFKEVQNCSGLGGGSGSGTTSCPSGFTKIESAGNALGCISTDRRKEAVYQDALSDCFLNYGGRFPSYYEAYTAFNNYNLNDEPSGSDYELVNEITYDYYFTTAASGTQINNAILYSASRNDFSPTYYSIGTAPSALPAQAYHRCFVPAGGSSSLASTEGALVEIDGGVLDFNDSENIGSGWDYVSFNGIFFNSDSSTAGGYIYKKTDGNYYAALFAGNGGHDEFQVTTAEQCSTGTTFGICTQLSGDDLIISTKGLNRVEYASIKFGGKKTHVESDNNVTADSCDGTIDGDGVCDQVYYRDITFDTPFDNTPHVVVGFEHPSYGTACAGGAADGTYVKATNITTTGFRLYSAASPIGTSSCASEGNWYPGVANWLAIEEGTGIVGSGSGGADTDWAESGGNVYRENGYVGIGVTTPNALLHLKTDPGSNAEIDIQSGNANHWALYHDEASEELRFWNSDIGGDNHGLVIQNDGDVEINNGKLDAQELCIDGDCKSDWSAVGGGGGGSGATINMFHETCNRCNKNVAIGSHNFCALSQSKGFMSASGNCEVFQSGGIWRFRLRDDFSTNLECTAICVSGL